MQHFQNQDMLIPDAQTVFRGASQPNRTEIILHIQNLTKIYGNARNPNATKALNSMNLDVYQHEFISIMGPSGSGKRPC